MAELANCPRCGDVFAKTYWDVCRSCYEAEEAAFATVYHFLHKQENREATLSEIARATSVSQSLIIKFIKEGRLHPSDHPNLTYPCERCGAGIIQGKLCAGCTKALKNDLDTQENFKELKENNRETPANIYRLKR